MRVLHVKLSIIEQQIDFRLIVVCLGRTTWCYNLPSPLNSSYKRERETHVPELLVWLGA